MKKYVVLEKQVGETPLQCAEAWRKTATPAFANVPLAYAGRLDPMASGKLLLLIGEECKRQTTYHNLDKAYHFSILFGVHSDTADVLGIITTTKATTLGKSSLDCICSGLTGPIKLPYPHYSSKTVKGKPLHTWALEGRLDEIEIPTKTSDIYKLHCTNLYPVSTEDVYQTALTKIDSLPPVTDPKKALGNDFRRPDVKASWQAFLTQYPDLSWQIADFHCIASSGTYMRTLAEVIARRAGTKGLAWSIHRTEVGRYQPLTKRFGLWRQRFR